MIEDVSVTQGYPVTFSKTFSVPYNDSKSSILLDKEHDLIKELVSKDDCVIDGRGADVVLVAHLSKIGMRTIGNKIIE